MARFVPAPKTFTDFLRPEFYGALGDGVTNDRAAIQACLDAAASAKISEVRFRPVTYILNTGLTIPPGVTLVGSGWREGQGSLLVQGTILKRGANVTLISVLGTTILSGGPHYNNCSMRDLILDGADFLSDLVSLKHASYINWTRVFCRASTGRLLYMAEVWDSRFIDCSWEWGGSADGTIPAIEMVSGGAFEYTNQLMFFGCRMESIRGTGFKSTGTNTNEIWFNSFKIESGSGNFPLVDLTGVNNVHFDMQLASSGDGTATIAASMKLASCTHVSGFVKFEHIGVAGDGNTSPITTFLALTGCKHVSLVCDVYGSVIPATALVTTDGVNANTVDVLMRSDVLSSIQPAKTLTRYGTVSVTAIASEPGVYFSREDINDQWSIGRLVADSTGVKWRILHSATAVFEYGFDNIMKPLLGFVCSDLYSAANFLKLGSYRIWIDSKSRLRYKNSTPSSEVDGVLVQTNIRGITSGRPTDAAIGEMYYDTTLGKPVWLHSAGVWHDGSGAVV